MFAGLPLHCFTFPIRSLFPVLPSVRILLFLCGAQIALRSLQELLDPTLMVGIKSLLLL